MWVCSTRSSAGSCGWWGPTPGNLAPVPRPPPPSPAPAGPGRRGSVPPVIASAARTAVVSLDGEGSTTFIIVTSALLPVFLRLGMSPVVLTCVTAITNGVLNIVPWGGPTARASAALNVSPTDIFVPMIPAMIAGIIACFVLAWSLGRSERKRIGRADLPIDREIAKGGTEGSVPTPTGTSRRPLLPTPRGAAKQAGGVLVSERTRQDVDGRPD